MKQKVYCADCEYYGGCGGCKKYRIDYWLSNDWGPAQKLNKNNACRGFLTKKKKDTFWDKLTKRVKR